MKTRISIGLVLGAASVALACSAEDRHFGTASGGAAGSDSSTAGVSSAGSGADSQATTGGAGSGGVSTVPSAGGAGAGDGAGAGGSDAGAGGSADSGAGGQLGTAGAAAECPAESCCVAGKRYSASQKNPANACAHCDPAKSVTDFVGLPDTTSCGTGCVCRGGVSTETECADKVDNDGDSETNCADVDCNGRICANLVTAKVFTTSDAQERFGQGAGMIEDGATISVSGAPSTTSRAVLTFDTVPVDARSFEVKSAKLFFYMSDASEIAKIIFDGDDGDPAKDYGEFTPIRFATGYQNVDITTLVKDWVSGKLKKRVVFMSWKGEIPGGTTIRASEHAGTTSDPYIEITYTSKCDADRECPQP